MVDQLQKRVGSLVVMLVVLVWAGDANAFRLYGYAKDIRGRLTPGIRFNYTCTCGAAGSTYTRGFVVESGADGYFDINHPTHGPLLCQGSTVQACRVERAGSSDHRVLDWAGTPATGACTSNAQCQFGTCNTSQGQCVVKTTPQGYTIAGDYCQVLYGVNTCATLSPDTAVVNQDSLLNSPWPDYEIVNSKVRGAYAHLFLSADNKYDKPIVVLDGWDPTNSRWQAEIWSGSPMFFELMQQGVDVWIVNYHDGYNTVRSHINEAAWSMWFAQQGNLSASDCKPTQLDATYGFWDGSFCTPPAAGSLTNTQVRGVIGISEGGLAGRVALAGWEQAVTYKRAGNPATPNGQWFDFYNSTAVTGMVDPNVGVFISWDSPQRGGVAGPTELRVAAQRFVKVGSSYFCHPTFWMKTLGALAGAFVGAMFGGFLPGPLIYAVAGSAGLGFLTVSDIYEKKMRDGAGSMIDKVLNSGPTKDFSDEWCGYDITCGTGACACPSLCYYGNCFPDYGYKCSASTDVVCTTALHETFMTEIAAFENGNGGYPRLTKAVAFSNGTWDPMRCDVVNQWTPLGWDSTKQTCSAAHVHTHAVGEVSTFLDLPADKGCSDITVHVDAEDLQGGSTTDLIGAAVSTMDPEIVGTVHFLSVYTTTKASLDMDSATSPTKFWDVVWQDAVFTHQQVAGVNPRNGVESKSSKFIAAYMLEYLFPEAAAAGQPFDGDGYVTCAAIPNIKGTGPIGKKQACDAYPTDPTRYLALAADGEVCSSSAGCSSGYCYPGPEGASYCIAAAANCAKPGTSGIMFGESYSWNGLVYTCTAGVGLTVCGAGSGCQGGETCASCPTDCGACACTPSCSGKLCGASNGCGGTCCAGSGCTLKSCSCPYARNTCGSACVYTGCSSGCFAAGTPITMADGSVRAIETIEAGDSVLSYDVEAQVSVPSVVTETFVHSEDIWGTILINGTLQTTPNHPFYANGGWVRADELRPGDDLVTLSMDNGVAGAGREPGRVMSLESLPGQDTVYNLEVDVHHNYFAAGVLVHNKITPPL